MTFGTSAGYSAVRATVDMNGTAINRTISFLPVPQGTAPTSFLGFTGGFGYLVVGRVLLVALFAGLAWAFLSGGTRRDPASPRKSPASRQPGDPPASGRDP